MPPQLRDYQIKAIQEVFQAWEHCMAVMLQMPTGTGKTQVFSQIIKTTIEHKAPGKRALVLVHRKELLEQVCDRLRDFGIVAGKITAGQDYDSRYQVQVATVQSLIRRTRIILNLSLIVVDEAHHTPASTYQELIHVYRKSDVKLLGVTATPHRLDGKGFSQTFDHLVQSMTIPEFITEGYLADVEHMASSIPDLSKIQINSYTYDYEDKALRAVMQESKLIADVVKAFEDHCVRDDGSIRKTMVFCVDSKHAEDIVSKYREKGHEIGFINWQTKPKEREQILQDFKHGSLSILCNVEIFTEGFDCPDIEVVQLVRPTKSLSLYLQMIGRCLRPKPNGSKATLLDHSNLWLEHRHAKHPRSWTLEGTEDLGSNGKFISREGISILKERPEEAKGLIIDRFQKYFEDEEVYHPDVNIEDVKALSPFWKKLLTKSLNDFGMDDEELKDALIHTRTLNLSNTKIKTLVPIRFLTHLKSIILSDSRLESTKSLENFRYVRSLTLKGTRINSLTYVRTLESLQYLDLSEIEVSSLQQLIHLTQLKSLKLSNSKIADWKSIGSLRRLSRLNLRGSNFKDVAHIVSLKYLKHLDLSETSISRFALIRMLPSLEELIIRGVTTEDYKEIKKLGNLKRLDLSYSNVLDISFIDDLPNLEELDISGISFDYININPKRNLNLKKMYIYHPSMGDEDVELEIHNLSKQMPWCDFYYRLND
jgi:superfamily II DNA or RNA helicase